jgi:guanylate kinase
MIHSTQKKLIILAGPSCVGKTPLKEAFAKFYQELYAQMIPLVLFNSRGMRPGESEGVHYFFRSEKEIKKLQKNPQFIVFKVHDDYQAIDINQLSALLGQRDVFFEGNTTVGLLFQTHPELSAIHKLTIFLSPLSGEEIIDLRLRGKKYFRSAVQKIMRHKLLHRLKKFGTRMDSSHMADIRHRASNAYFELKEAHKFDHIIPNHDGEESDNWTRSLLPSGDAGRALDAFAAIISDKNHPNIEKWDENLVP